MFWQRRRRDTHLAVELVLARGTLYIAGRRVASESCSTGANQSAVTHAPAEPETPPPPPPDPTAAFPGNAPTCNTSATTSFLVSRQQSADSRQQQPAASSQQSECRRQQTAGSCQHAILPAKTRGKVTASCLYSLIKHFGIQPNKALWTVRRRP